MENKQINPECELMIKANSLGYIMRRSSISESIALIPNRNAKGLAGDGTKVFATEVDLRTWISKQVDHNE